jgi:predicted nucleic acid-binding protein
MRRKVYIETAVPSFYVERREEPALMVRRETTRKWWAEEAPRYDLFISPFVVDELDQGEYPGKREALALVADLPALEAVPEIEDIAAGYVQHRLMPRGERGDAAHLAVASYYAVDFLLTWNCRHLANANKVRHLTEINNRLGLFVPIVTTPESLFLEEVDDV